MIDVGSMTSEEIDKKMRELYEKTDEGWKCLVCVYTTKGPKSANIRVHVETHLDGLVYTCNLCSKEFRSRNILGQHKMNTHKTSHIQMVNHKMLTLVTLGCFAGCEL